MKRKQQQIFVIFGDKFVYHYEKVVTRMQLYRNTFIFICLYKKIEGGTNQLIKLLVLASVLD